MISFTFEIAFGVKVTGFGSAVVGVVVVGVVVVVAMPLVLQNTSGIITKSLYGTQPKWARHTALSVGLMPLATNRSQKAFRLQELGFRGTGNLVASIAGGSHNRWP
jgi:hypothetical protein